MSDPAEQETSHPVARPAPPELAPSRPGWREYELAKSAAEAADALMTTAEPLRESDGVAASTSLLREAVHWALAAELAYGGEPAAPDAPIAEVWGSYARRVGLDGLRAAIGAAALDRARTVSLQRTFASSAALPEDERRAELDELRTLTDALLAHLGGERAARIRKLVTRAVLIGAGALIAIIVAVVATKAIRAKLRGPNLALHAPATMTSHLAGWPDARGCDDGDTSALGCHTDNDEHPSWQVDLGSTRKIARVVVYNRTDSFGDRAVPLAVQVSVDGKAFHEVARRADVFDVWTCQIAPTDARYVRLEVQKRSWLHLNEVEVYAH